MPDFRRVTVRQRLAEWFDGVFWTLVLIVLSSHAAALGISTFYGESLGGVAFYLFQWISPEAYLLWSLSVVPFAVLTILTDPHRRLQPWHFAPATSYLVIGIYSSLNGFFPTNLAINYAVIVAFQLFGLFRTLTWPVEE